MTCTHDTTYDQDYYDRQVEVTAVHSAPAMAKSIVGHFRPRTVIDVGCGTGALLEAFRNLKCEVRGLEYSEAGLAYCGRRKLAVRKFNIGTDKIDDKRYDIATSFEVAEHLAPRLADEFVDLLCKLSSVVVMSAATPGQGGRDHVNEQPHSYWIGKFAERRYFFDKQNADRFSSDWREAGTSEWYHNNVMIFIRTGYFLSTVSAFMARRFRR